MSFSAERSTVVAIFGTCLLIGVASILSTAPVMSQSQDEITISINDSTNGQANTTVPVSISDGNQNPSVPSDWEGSSEQYFAIYENGERPGTQEVSTKLNNWFNSDNNTVNGVEFGTQELSQALNYWFADI